MSRKAIEQNNQNTQRKQRKQNICIQHVYVLCVRVLYIGI
ncbi:hypothetical protein HMPREF1575_01278 [Gardnerella vaginalis JCP7672]|nr:hypothetical protein HMPREF1575_01278 [Gardnerella vaginalis JCP7672]